MASCWVLSGLVLLAVAFMASAVSFVAPYWYSLRGAHTGLWAHCPPRLGKCNWFFEDDFSWEKDQEDWWFACQGLFGVGVLVLLCIFLVACINLCCGCCKGTMAITHTVAGSLIFSFVLIAISLGLSAFKVNKDRHVNIIGDANDDRLLWGFWVGAGGACTALLASLFYLCEGCRSHSHDGYTRGGVV